MPNQALIGVCLVLSLASCASAPGPATSSVTPAATPALPVGCISPDSEARLPAHPINCATPASVSPRPSIDRTGQADTAEALRMLSPALTVHGSP